MGDSVPWGVLPSASSAQQAFSSGRWLALSWEVPHLLGLQSVLPSRTPSRTAPRMTRCQSLSLRDLQPARWKHWGLHLALELQQQLLCLRSAARASSQPTALLFSFPGWCQVPRHQGAHVRLSQGPTMGGRDERWALGPMCVGWDSQLPPKPFPDSLQP